jgi:hypothetical protein
MRVRFVWMIAGVLLLLSATILSGQESGGTPAQEPLLSTGVTGSISASGLDDPCMFCHLFLSSV